MGWHGVGGGGVEHNPHRPIYTHTGTFGFSFCWEAVLSLECPLSGGFTVNATGVLHQWELLIVHSMSQYPLTFSMHRLQVWL